MTKWYDDWLSNDSSYGIEFCNTSTDYNIAMTKLYSINLGAAVNLNAISLHKLTLHVHYDATQLYGWQTDSCFGREQAIIICLKPRLVMPFEFFKVLRRLLWIILKYGFNNGWYGGKGDAQLRLGKSTSCRNMSWMLHDML